MERFVNVQDVINKVQQRTLDGGAYYNHLSNGTINDYYRDVIMETITDITIFAIERELAGFEPAEDAQETLHAFAQIIEMVATLFNKTKPDVEADLISMMHEYPVEEVREAQHLRHNNLLH